MRKLTLGAIALAASTMIGSTASHATFIVDIFANQAAAVGDLRLFNGSTATSSGQFTTNAINFTDPGGNTVGSFIGSCGFCGVAGLSPAEMAVPLQNTVLRFTDATATAAAAALGLVDAIAVAAGTVAIFHDDGVLLGSGSQLAAVMGDIISAPIAAPPTLNGPVPFGSSPRSVTLLYGEGFGLPATLQTNLVNVPEPASLALLGSALVGFGVWRRRRRTS